MAEQRRRELEIRERQQYSTVLQTVSAHPRNVVGCKDGTIYTITGNGLGRVIGSYKKESNGDLKIYNAEEYEIGSVHNSNIYLLFFGMLKKYPHLDNTAYLKSRKHMWLAAEITERSIIDSETYTSIFYYDGNTQEASAAFVCWAYEGYDNKYSDFYKI